MQDFSLIITGGGSDRECTVHINRRFPSFYAIQLMTGGSMTFQREGCQVAEFSESTFFWTERESRYVYGPGKTGSWQHNWISFTGHHADSYYRPLLEALAPEGHVTVDNSPSLQAAFDNLLQSIHKPGESITNVHRLNRILVRADQGRLRQHSPQDRIQAIKEAIDSDPEQRYDFPALARKSGHSYSTFRRRFRERFDCAPHTYLIRRRMDQAARLLVQTDDAIQEIGFRLGYDDPARFSKSFKQHHGLSPRAYRYSSLQLHQGLA